MIDRWTQIVEKCPSIDYMDIQSEMTTSFSRKNQFAPEYSNDMYSNMLEQSDAIGDYTSYPDFPLMVSSDMRMQMVKIIEDLHLYQKYKLETFFLAVSLADRYLIFTAAD